MASIDNALWVGDPEAISSVRRPRKPPCRQRMEQQIWARSRSLKERPTSSSSYTKSLVTSSNSSFGSCGVNNLPGPTKGQLSPSNSVRGTCSRVGSLKESRLSSSSTKDSVGSVDTKPRRSSSVWVSKTSFKSADSGGSPRCGTPTVNLDLGDTAKLSGSPPRDVTFGPSELRRNYCRSPISRADTVTLLQNISESN